MTSRVVYLPESLQTTYVFFLTLKVREEDGIQRYICYEIDWVTSGILYTSLNTYDKRGGLCDNREKREITSNGKPVYVLM